MWSIDQVARAWPPSVVFIGDCERTFMKKIPKTDKVNTKYLLIQLYTQTDMYTYMHTHAAYVSINL